MVSEGSVVLKNSIQPSHQLSLESFFDCRDLGTINSRAFEIDRLALDKEHAKATLMYRAGHITIDEYSDITANLLQSLSDDDERRSSPIMYRYDSVIEALENVTEEEVVKCSVRGWYFRDRGNKLVRRLKQGEFNTNVQGAWHEMKETLKWLNGLNYRAADGIIYKAYGGSREEDYYRWKRLCINAKGEDEGSRFAACIPTPDKWEARKQGKNRR